MICYQQHFYDPTRPLDVQKLAELTQSEYVNTTVTACREHMKNNDRQSYDRAKRGLPLIIYCATFQPNTGKQGKNPEDTWREQRSARLNGLVMVDFDHIAQGDRPSVRKSSHMGSVPLCELETRAVFYFLLFTFYYKLKI